MSTRVYVGQLPDRATAEQIKEYFERHGIISQIELKHGYGFIDYEDEASVTMALEQSHGKEFMGSKLRVEKAKALDPSRGGSHQGGRTPVPGEGACFRCGEEGHWARECPNRGTSTSRRPYRESHGYSPEKSSRYRRDVSPVPRDAPYYDPYYSRPLPPPYGYPSPHHAPYPPPYYPLPPPGRYPDNRKGGSYPAPDRPGYAADRVRHYPPPPASGSYDAMASYSSHYTPYGHPRDEHRLGEVRYADKAGSFPGRDAEQPYPYRSYGSGSLDKSNSYAHSQTGPSGVSVGSYSGSRYTAGSVAPSGNYYPPAGNATTSLAGPPPSRYAAVYSKEQDLAALNNAYHLSSGVPAPSAYDYYLAKDNGGHYRSPRRSASPPVYR